MWLLRQKKTIESQLQEIILSTSSKNPEKLMVESTMVELKEEKGDYLLEDVDEKVGLLDNEEANDNNIINDVKNSFGANPLEDIDDKLNIIENNNNNDNDNNNIIQLVENGEVKQEEEVKENNEEQKQEENNNNNE